MSCGIMLAVFVAKTRDCSNAALVMSLGHEHPIVGQVASDGISCHQHLMIGL